jgi:hypothetical protein
MELEVKKKSTNRKKFQTITGFVSFLLGLIGLAGLNGAMLLETVDYPELFLYYFPILGAFFGIIGLFTKNRSRLHAWWGLGINLFILLFTAMMFILAWSINAKP